MKLDTQILDFISDLVSNWLKNILSAFQNAWRRLGQTFVELNTFAESAAQQSSWGWLYGLGELVARLLILPFDILGILDTLIGDLATAQNEAMISTAVKTLVPPPDGFKNGVITRAQAWSEFLNFILSTGYGIVSLHIPLPVKVTLILKRFAGTIKLLTDTNMTLWEKLLEKVSKTLIKAFRLGVVRAVLAVLQFWGCFLLIMLAYFFVDFVRSNQLLKPLSQSAPRKKVHSKEDGVIRRREPGGSPP